MRKYIAIVTVSLVSLDGKVMAKTEDLSLSLDMNDFPDGAAAADEYMKDELSTMLAAVCAKIEDCFN